jgi:hypothetical protein
VPCALAFDWRSARCRGLGEICGSGKKVFPLWDSRGIEGYAVKCMTWLRYTSVLCDSRDRRYWQVEKLFAGWKHVQKIERRLCDHSHRL